MAEVVRFSVSLEGELLEAFDRYCEANRFPTRSEAIRQLLREALTRQAWEAGSGEVAATLTLVYDHHRARLSDRLLEIQHRHTDVVVASSHVHLDHENCLEVIFLRGRPDVLREIASQLRALKGIRKGELVVASPSGHGHP
ncbi:MAG TPA: nickel-responsive transcriptional regulator NikR [Gemmataceae bacterium]